MVVGCKFWLVKKKSFCAIPPLPDSEFCSNHSTRPDDRWILGSIDPTHSVLESKRMESGQYLGEISALCFLHLPPPSSSLPYLLAGSGSQLLFYDLHTGNMIASFQVFKGVRVHGISCSPPTDASLTFRVALFGERMLKLFLFTIQLPDHNKQTLVYLLSFQSLPNFGHWILDVCFMQDCEFLAIGCTDNSVYFWDTSTSTSTISYEVSSPDRCLLYTMRIWGDKIDSLRVASGTIYNQIIVWKVVCGDNDHKYKAVPVCRLAGHEGSIFRITWSFDGSKLVSVSDDRSARIWEVVACDDSVPPSIGPVLFGHSARVWDCCMSDSLIVTVGEDCTCRVWGPDGTQLRVIKEHIGRGVWRCLYDPRSCLLVTAGFDSAIKVHELHSSLAMGLGCNERKQMFTIQIPNSNPTALMDSKSEYVRCMHLASEDELYVATNKGFLYLAKISDTGHATWTQLFCSQEEIPIVCMTVFPGEENWIALGDGKGRLTIVDIQTPNVNPFFTWPAESERQLLGAYWCKSLGHRYIFTADPRGRLKLWKIGKPFQSSSMNASLVAEFTSSFPTRIICLDASFEEEVLVCGDLRGNLVLFPLLKDLLLDAPDASVPHIVPLNYFKGAHGISSVTSVSIHAFSPTTFELHSTGGDGCICYMEYDRYEQKMEFIGMKQVKELSLVQTLFRNDIATGKYAIGFTSSDFIIWNLSTETKVAGIPCGGWRRPHALFLGDVPEMKNCFAFVKDEVIYIHKQSVPSSERIYPQNLHLQFHGREIHSLCFILDHTQSSSDESAFVATGCEDGTVRLTSYSCAGIDKWSGSRLLGEHVGGSAVRSLCCVLKVHIVDETDTSQERASEDDELLLISVGAKRVLTAWKRKSNKSSSMSFQWLSSDLPTRNRGNKAPPQVDGLENDWRYLAVTAFLVKFSGSRTSVCFIVVSCSDATLTLRALVLPHRLWFDIALLVPSTSPVLSLQHVIVPQLATSKDKSAYIVISGSTDGSIAFWDVTETVETFMDKVSALLSKEDCNKFQTRPCTGRGSQGGRRRWRTLDKDIQDPISSSSSSLLDLGCSTSQEIIDTIQPLHVVKNVHQSGVNCLHVSDVNRRCESRFSCNLISGGDDQALHSLTFDVMGMGSHCSLLENKYQIVFSDPDKIASAHSSAVKGVWTDGHWVFSTGLDQRVRCWRVSVDGKLTEQAHLIVSVPEPEALDVRVCGRNLYQIAVAGRGMQMMEFLAPILPNHH